MKRARLVILCFVIAFLGVVSRAFAQDTWHLLGVCAYGRYYPGTIPLDNQSILIAGGAADNAPGDLAFHPVDQTEIVDLQKPWVSSESKMKHRRGWFTLVLTADSNVLAIAGATSYILGSNPRQPIDHYLMEPSVEFYSRKDKQWKTIGNLLVPRMNHSSIRINDDEILVVGGRDSLFRPIASSEIFNVKTGKSRLVGAYPNACAGINVARNQFNTIVAVGGDDGKSSITASTDVNTFDTVLENWTKLGTINTIGSVWMSMIKLPDGRLLLSGGRSRDTTRIQCSSTIWISSESGFDSVALLTQPRCGHAMAYYGGSKVVISGGFVNTLDPSETTELFDFKKNESVSFQKHNYSRALHSLFSLPVRKVDETSPTEYLLVAIGGVRTMQDGIYGQRSWSTLSTVEELNGVCRIIERMDQLVIDVCDIDRIRKSGEQLGLQDVPFKQKWSTGDSSVFGATVFDYGTYTVKTLYKNGCKGYGEVVLMPPPAYASIVRVVRSFEVTATDSLLHTIRIDIANPNDSTIYVYDSKYGIDIVRMHNTNNIEYEYVDKLRYPGLCVKMLPHMISSLTLRYMTVKGNLSTDTLYVRPSGLKWSATDLREMCPIRLTLPYDDKGTPLSDSTTTDYPTEVAELREGKNFMIQISPNPANTTFTLSGMQSGGIARIYTLLGECIRTWPVLYEGQSHDVSSMEIGTYVLELAQGCYNKKFMFQVVH